MRFTGSVFGRRVDDITNPGYRNTETDYEKFRCEDGKVLPTTDVLSHMNTHTHSWAHSLRVS